MIKEQNYKGKWKLKKKRKDISNKVLDYTNQDLPEKQEDQNEY